MNQWITVLTGSHPQVLTVQALLEARGIPTFIPDQTTKVMDPFITGANPFSLDLCVPAEAVGDARRVLAEGRGQPRLVDDDDD